MHGLESPNNPKQEKNSSNLVAILGTGGSQNCIHPSFISKKAIITNQPNTIIQSFGQYQTKKITKMNCKFLETGKVTEFIVLNEAQDPIIIIGFGYFCRSTNSFYPTVLKLWQRSWPKWNLQPSRRIQSFGLVVFSLPIQR